MELTREKLDELRSLVNAALPKMAWLHDGGDVSDEDGTLVAECAEASDAAFIAAFDPPTVLALLDALEAAQAEAAKCREAAERLAQQWADDTQCRNCPVLHGCAQADASVEECRERLLAWALREPVTPAVMEEVGEVAEAVLANGKKRDLRAELVQVAALALQMIEHDLKEPVQFGTDTALYSVETGPLVTDDKPETPAESEEK